MYGTTDRTSPCAIWEVRAVGACILGLVFFSGLSVFSAFSAFEGADRCYRRWCGFWPVKVSCDESLI